MGRKIGMILAGAATLLIAAGILFAQPGPGRGPMGQWFRDLERAYEQKDMDRIGALIQQMNEQQQSFRGRMREGRPDMPPPGMRGPGGGSRTAGQPIESRDPLAKSDAERKILAVLDEMDRTQRRGNMNVPTEDGRLLRLLTEAVGAKHVVEIGTSNGYSAIWQALALKATGGKLTTFEIDSRRAAMARENLRKAGVEDVVTVIEGDAHEEVEQVDGPIDILFLDADKEGYIDYLNKLLPKLRPGGLIVAHNINPRQADPRFVEAITTNPDLETLILNHTGGVSVTLKKRGLP
jgi:predicted O-methyltransferase YrrM